MMRDSIQLETYTKMILQLSELKRSIKLERHYHVLLLLVIFHSSTLEAATNGLQPGGTQCACAGDRLIYNCSIVGGTATLWRGTAFDCPMGDFEITLRHSQFAANQGITGICNNGDLVARSIGVVNNCYTSQLNVTVRESFNNKTVQCASVSLVETRTIGESLLSVTSATNRYPPPDNVYLADAQPGTLVFKWTPVVSSNCSTLYAQYDITSDCGACPAATSMTTATCSNLQLSTNAVLCHFSVSSRACSLVGNSTSPTAVILKVPDVPQVEIIPSYSTDSQALKNLFVVTAVNQTEDLFYISGNISGFPTSYIAHASSINGASFNSTVDLFSCEEAGGCPIELPSTYCSQSTTINVTISAANKLGEGPPSNPFLIECMNDFMQVVYRDTSTISCIFLNQSDTSKKTCCVTYRRCDQKKPGNTPITNCSRDSSYNIHLEVADYSSQNYYCYTVTASNDTHTVKVEGTFTLGDNRKGNRNRNIAAITAGIIVPIVFILLVLGTLSLVWVVKNRPIKDPLKLYLTPYTIPTLKPYKVQDGDRDLRDFITNVVDSESKFRRGHTYYEFTNKVENILEGKEVLLQDKKNTEKWFQLAPPEEVSAGGLKLYGAGIARSSFGDQYRVFIQSFGSGARHLPRGSSILYNFSEDQVEPDVLPLVPVCSEHFAHEVIDSEECVQDFCTQKGLNTAAYNVFLTVEHLPKGMRDHPPRDVILMDRVSGDLFTGPFARQMLNPRNGGEVQQQKEKWKVFVLLRKNKQGLILQKNSEVLYQDSRYMNGKYSVLEVDEDCVRMSKFIETKLDCQYKDGKAFYVAGKEEDLLYCKKILRPQKEQLSHEQVELQSLIQYFYAIGGVPTKEVKLKELRHSKVFIQSTSQGSRCLKQGDKLLYLKEYISSNDRDDPDDAHSDSVSEDEQEFDRLHDHN